MSRSVEEYYEYSHYSGSVGQGGITEHLNYTVPGKKHNICLRTCNFSKRDCELQLLYCGSHWPTLPVRCLNYGSVINVSNTCKTLVILSHTRLSCASNIFPSLCHHIKCQFIKHRSHGIPPLCIRDSYGVSFMTLGVLMSLDPTAA